MNRRRLLRPANVASGGVVAARSHDGVTLRTEALFHVRPGATLHGGSQLRLVADTPVVNDLGIQLVSEDAAQRAEKEFVAAMDDEELARHRVPLRKLAECRSGGHRPTIGLSLSLQNVVANAGYHGDVPAVVAHGTHHMVDMAVPSALPE
jgi:hypothetical protein